MLYEVIEEDNWFYRHTARRANELYWELRSQRELLEELGERYRDAQETLRDMEYEARNLSSDMIECGLDPSFFDLEY